MLHSSLLQSSRLWSLYLRRSGGSCNPPSIHYCYWQAGDWKQRCLAEVFLRLKRFLTTVYESLRAELKGSPLTSCISHMDAYKLTEVKFTAATLASSFNPSQRSDGKFKPPETKDELFWTLFERLKTILLLGWIDYINGICTTAI